MKSRQLGTMFTTASRAAVMARLTLCCALCSRGFEKSYTSPTLSSANTSASDSAETSSLTAALQRMGLLSQSMTSPTGQQSTSSRIVRSL